MKVGMLKVPVLLYGTYLPVALVVHHLLVYSTKQYSTIVIIV